MDEVTASAVAARMRLSDHDAFVEWECRFADESAMTYELGSSHIFPTGRHNAVAGGPITGR